MLLSGEAGIGKSRLTVAVLERLADEPHTRLRYFCSPERTRRGVSTAQGGKWSAGKVINVRKRLAVVS